MNESIYEIYKTFLGGPVTLVYRKGCYTISYSKMLFINLQANYPGDGILLKYGIFRKEGNNEKYTEHSMQL